MTSKSTEAGLKELREARRESRGLYWMVGLFSFFANLLMLTGPIYMLQVYDRVLGSRSEATLIALSLLVLFLYGIMGILDYTRGRVMARAAARFQSRMDARVFDAVIRRSVQGHNDRAQTGLADLSSIRRLISSPVLVAFFDLPWTPVFLAGIALFHPWLGLLAIAGGGILILITLLNQVFSRRPMMGAAQAQNASSRLSEELRNEAETVQAMGMRQAAFIRWGKARTASLEEEINSTDVTGSFTSITKSIRLFLQSAMLGLGAYLVLQNELTPGGMIAASILLGRALAPIELVIGQWQLVQIARQGWSSLGELLGEMAPEAKRTELPRPKARVEVKNLTVVPPGERHAVVKNLSFSVEPGEAVGIIGPSGSGKSTIARALTGVWRPAGGSLRLDGATLDQYSPEALGQHIGYLPQRVELFEGTIAQNIARLQEAPDSERVVQAAQKAAAHDLITKLPGGYDTPVSTASLRLSGGQAQRVGLARALYGDPVLLILDEPNANLDSVGSAALNAAVREMKADGRSVLIMAHRPAAIQECDKLLVIDNGSPVAFGPKEEVLRKTVQNYQSISRVPGQEAAQ
ncbi:type I secretion system permease/ATPase [Aestuariivita sp.]|jgi:ATP-binding cassette subfamily C protein|uniref:type I secretion system permease/ATPase n=1 Tax=Aestuariivita sp. TaxID=1872407 RepID=UPI00216CB082|nr:type I secretion system permease/ATPase [Aestuariivita sp.]MCE8007081.1 type I secretion system permease/ATPase [Aestuariivita sp.]